MDRAKVAVENLLAEADIKVNGSRPWDIRVRNDDFYARVVRGGSLAFGETYLAGYWDADRLDELIARLFSSHVTEKARVSFTNLAAYLSATVRRRGAKSSAFEIGRRHYDTGNDLFERMLDRRMVYTCAYWKDAKDLDEAQEAKLDLVCRKIGLQKDQHVLDIGCGWGSFAKFAAERYGARVTGITVSKEQVALGREMCQGLPVEFRLQDYRDVTGTFDHIISLGMFEHVGTAHYAEYMQVAHDHLKDGGLFLLHTIGTNRSGLTTEPWIDKYIFPNGALPSVAEIGKALEGRFVMEDWHNFGAYYDKTLMAWFANFDRRWPEISAKYGETFYRMWKYYLLACAGSFRARANQLWQIVLSKDGVPGGYRPVR
ncbi:MAG TPA: cyclopropane fatty acyl phospholipid synthase [Candidatus Paceibacterota bacterium]|nr:cyclopropane fatty acyl phospholipid synthase [Candidatus Paceibacterota bacterium]